jgi:hypothetical protein
VNAVRLKEQLHSFEDVRLIVCNQDPDSFALS